MLTTLCLFRWIIHGQVFIILLDDAAIHQICHSRHAVLFPIIRLDNNSSIFNGVCGWGSTYVIDGGGLYSVQGKVLHLGD